MKSLEREFLYERRWNLVFLRISTNGMNNLGETSVLFFY